MPIVLEETNTNTAGGGGTDLTLTLTEVNNGDIIAVSLVGASAGGGSSFTISPPSIDWQEVDQLDAGSLTRLGVFYFVADGTETNFTFTYSDTVSGRRGGIARCSGASATNVPTLTNSSSNTGESSTDRIGLSIDTDADDSLVAFTVWWSTNDDTLTPPAGFTTRWKTTRSLGHVDSIQETAGATGNLTATGTDTSWATVVFALEPEDTGTSGSIEGTTSGSATITGGVVASGVLDGISDSTATLSGILTGNGFLESLSSGITTVTGTLTGIGNLEGLSSGTVAAMGAISGGSLLAGASDGFSSVTGALSGAGDLEGAIEATSIVTGNISLFVDGIFGISEGVASVTGSLSGVGFLVGVSSGSAIVAASFTNNSDIVVLRAPLLAGVF